MKTLLFTALMMISFALISNAQHTQTKNHYIQQNSKPVKFTAHIARVTQFKGNGKIALLVKSNEYKQPIQLIVSDIGLEPTSIFFTGECIAVTGYMRSRNGYQEIIVMNASQIKPILVDNIVSNGGFK